jgi:cobalt-zinc-cadmium efflux system membrane fusion protein
VIDRAVFARAAFAARAALAAACSLGVAASGASCKGEKGGEAEHAPAKGAEGGREGARLVELSPEALAAAKLVVEAAELGERAQATLVAGSIEFVPNRVARVGPRVSGRVTSLKVAPGERVAPGAVLATVDSVEVARARADYAAAAAQAELAERELERERQLLGSKATTEREVNAARAKDSVGRVELRAAQERLRAFGVGAPGADAGAGAVVLTTPLGGTVLDVKARVGQSVGPGDTPFVVGEIDEVWLVVDVHERYYPFVREGDAVKVSVLAVPDRTFEGRVDSISGVLDEVTKAARARIVLPNPDRALKPGMSARARVVHGSGPAERVVTVPRAALQTIDGLPFAFVERRPGAYEVRAVERGAEADGRVEVKRGVEAGERVVADGSFLLKSEVLREQMGKND